MMDISLISASYQKSSARASTRSWHRSTSALALALVALAITLQPGVALAQTADADQKVQGEDIIVTGSRIARDGSQAPTPVTVVGRDLIQAAAPENLADFVNQLPQLAGSSTPRNTNLGVTSGQSGFNSLNLRDLGVARTLVLIDGRRSVGSSDQRGLVDINTIPQKLVQRVDIVTGGASAVYGSDAVAGVVNFITDTKFTGVKSEVQGGITRYGDDATYQASLTAGIDFSDRRGHLLFDAEYARNEGVSAVNRDWGKTGYQIINNPAYTATNGQPQRLVATSVGFTNIVPGGIITNTKLKGTTFGPGGVPTQFNYGSVVSDPWMIGGDWQASNSVVTTNALDPATKRYNIMLRGDYEFSSSLHVDASFSYSDSLTVNLCCHEYFLGNLTMKADNAFLPTAVAQQAAALGISTFSFGKFLTDLPRFGARLDRQVYRGVLGLNGKFDALGIGWTWSAYGQHGEAIIDERATNVTNTARFLQAIDAVRNPSTGAIVCRSTLTDPTNGCVPFNVFGTGVNSPQAAAYLLGEASRRQKLTQDVVEAQISAHPFSTWAGPVGIATGVEHRVEKLSGTSDDISKTGGWFAGNFLPTNGSYNVTEEFAELDVPLAKDLPLASLLNFNGAVRFTNYSTSGAVTTWKAGLVYSPIKDIRIRVTRSRDIRAPNLQELYQAAACLNNAPVFNPFTGINDTARECSTGTTNLKPEIANTTAYGIVLQPRMIPGLTASVDYYDINITDGLITYARDVIVNNCFAGLQSYCDAVIRNATTGAILQVNRVPFNAASQVERGIDIDASYTRPLSDIVASWPGAVTLRYVGAHYIKNVLNPGVGLTSDLAGNNTSAGVPSWRHYITLAYNSPAFTGTITGRGISAGVYDNSFIQCTSGCPTSTAANTTINNNQIPGAFYLDLAATYRFRTKGSKIEVFGAISNLFNRDPVPVSRGPGFLPLVATNPSLYDMLGTTFRFGIRASL
ncbi:TonB-dependent receptor [Sphingomonas oligophenolica]|uniref:TonB-dependent receptor n=1 Tax=Sphingomonas oligophenolica TaxID=301154 RepID=A0ABU9Y696_9SPHN